MFYSLVKSNKRGLQERKRKQKTMSISNVQESNVSREDALLFFENPKELQDLKHKSMRELELELIQLKVDIANSCTTTEANNHQAHMTRNNVEILKNESKMLKVERERILEILKEEQTNISYLDGYKRTLEIVIPELKESFDHMIDETIVLKNELNEVNRENSHISSEIPRIQKSLEQTNSSIRKVLNERNLLRHATLLKVVGQEFDVSKRSKSVEGERFNGSWMRLIGVKRVMNKMYEDSTSNIATLATKIKGPTALAA